MSRRKLPDPKPEGSIAWKISKLHNETMPFIEFDPPISQFFRIKIEGKLPIPAEERHLVPKRANVEVRGGAINAIASGMSTGPWIVSRRVTEILEELEPEVHQFSALDFYDSKTGQFLETYHIILDVPKVDAIIIEETEWCRSNPEGGGGSAGMEQSYYPEIFCNCGASSLASPEAE